MYIQIYVKLSISSATNITAIYSVADRQSVPLATIGFDIIETYDDIDKNLYTFMYWANHLSSLRMNEKETGELIWGYVNGQPFIIPDAHLYQKRMYNLRLLALQGMFKFEVKEESNKLTTFYRFAYEAKAPKPKQIASGSHPILG